MGNERLKEDLATLRQQLAEAQAKLAAAERENEELRAKYEKLSKLNLAQHEMYEKDNNTLHDELAALKVQSTEQWNETMRQKKAWADGKDAEPFAWVSKYAVQLKESGALGAEVSFVNLGWTDQIELFTTPPTAAALVEQKCLEVAGAVWALAAPDKQVDSEALIAVVHSAMREGE